MSCLPVREFQQIMPCPAGWSVKSCSFEQDGTVRFDDVPIVCVGIVSSRICDENGRLLDPKDSPESSVEVLVFSETTLTVSDFDELTGSYSIVLAPGDPFDDEVKKQLVASLRRRRANYKKVGAA
jgi:hypothetical protein